ncbi:MAG: hypothetical protein MJK04_34640 [Psychrosphaera sp.]|nr:hypothetical protein [Psychrosphaera sp.]
MNKYFICCLMLASCLSWSLHGATLTGQIEVMKKGGRKAFDSAEFAVVYLSGIDNVLSTKAKSDSIKINQKEKRFFPRLMPIVKGQVVHFFNQDELDHNVFSTEKKKSFDLGRYPKGDFREVQYNDTGMYKVYCNIHQKMILDIVVLDNHYFAVTDEKGSFTIDAVPPGQYKLNVWHIYGGVSSKTITVGINGLQLPLAQVVSTKIVREVQKHKNKHGKKYKKKGRYRR